MAGRRTTLIAVAGVSVLSLGLGLAVGSRLVSPADAAARTGPPKASKITVPIERRALKSQVVTRADASFEGAVDIELEGGGDGGPAVVTGLVPKVGAKIREGEPLLEITGRPVIVLAGKLPMYRDLRPGMSGPDVEQLEKTLHRLGIDPGKRDDRYTADTSEAVEEMFDDAGYDPPAVDQMYRQAVKSARQEVRQAEKNLERVSAGPSETERVRAQNEVASAKRALAEAKQSGDATAIAEATERLRLAEAQLRDLTEPPDTSTERSALEKARNRLTKAQADAGTPLPIGEVTYVPSLPRRVDDLEVERGSVVDGKVMSVSGADLVLTATVDARTKALLREGMPATFDLGGSQVDAEVTRIERSDDGFDVVLTPKRLTNAQVELLRSSNVRATIPVSATDGKVLAVPVAALSAGPGGESRVEVLRNGTPKLVEVEVGLSAGGYAEIRPVEGTLRVGDKVVVGR